MLPLVRLPLLHYVGYCLAHRCSPVLLEVPQLRYGVPAAWIVLVHLKKGLDDHIVRLHTQFSLQSLQLLIILPNYFLHHRVSVLDTASRPSMLHHRACIEFQCKCQTEMVSHHILGKEEYCSANCGKY
uniref:Secreted protein n=1 Tax=Zea mays TaxID=4577 RepID=A0A804M0D5_MAIZE